jgi:hypothetical protein
MVTVLPQKKGIVWLQRNNILTILLIIIGVGMGITAFFTITNEYIPSSKNIITLNSSSSINVTNGSRIDFNPFEVVVSYEKNIIVPAISFINQKQTTITLIFFNNFKESFNPRQILLSSSESEFSLNGPSFLPSFHKQILPNGLEAWVLTTTIGHTLKTQNFTESYNIDILFRLDNKTYGPIYQLSIPIKLNLVTQDFNAPTYFWIIFSGVLISRVFSYSSKDTDENPKLQLNKLDLLWIPFSAVVTLIIFISFKQQIDLTNDLMTNLGLAFGFGFGFDKVLSTFQKR